MCFSSFNGIIINNNTKLTERWVLCSFFTMGNKMNELGVVRALGLAKQANIHSLEKG